MPGRTSRVVVEKCKWDGSAWESVSAVAPRCLTGDWPFDGWLHRTREQVFGGGR